MSEMACAATDDPEQIETYLLGDLDEPARESFETHLFECDRCLAHLRLLESLQTELPKATPALAPAASSRWWTWVAAAAALAIVAGGAAVLAPSEPPGSPSSPPAAVRTPAARSPEILALAKIDPPRYVALELRGAESAPGFDKAMRSYAAGNYAAAADGLRRVRRKGPADPQVDFFLGVSLLMTNDPVADAEALEPLRRVVSTGSSPYRQLASLYLGAALVRRGDLDGAEAEWEQAGRLPGTRGADAASQLQRLRSARGR